MQPTEVDAGKVIEALTMKIAVAAREAAIMEATIAALQARVAEVEAPPSSE